VKANHSEFHKNRPVMFHSSDSIVATVEDNCNLAGGLHRRASKNWKWNLCWFFSAKESKLRVCHYLCDKLMGGEIV